MPRPCFLVIDRQYAGSISTRKLVIETAKINVVTAYSGAEAIATLARFPAMDGVVLDAGVSDMACAEVVGAMKELQPAMPIIVIGYPRSGICAGADHELASFDPARLLALLHSLVPGATDQIERDEERLRQKP